MSRCAGFGGFQGRLHPGVQIGDQLLASYAKILARPGAGVPPERRSNASAGAA